MRNLSRFSGALLSLALCIASPAARAATTGALAGTVTDEATGKPIAGVTVTVTSSALQGEQTEFTDGSGRYIITELPPGEYMVRFYFSNVKVERPGVFLQADKTLPVNAALPAQKAKTQTYRIVEKAPSVDVSNSQIQTSVTTDLVRNTPVRGRTYDSVLSLAPGASTDAVGFSFSGSSGNENNYLIDGINTTNGAFGLLGTHLSLEFVGETEIITGGYNAEYGRATGGVVNVITKSGSNDFHGGAWFFYQPFQLDSTSVARSGEAIARQSKINHGFDFGFDVGGPIVKDRVWFYAGFHPQFQTDDNVRIFRHRTADDAAAVARVGAGDTYQGDLAAPSCPSYLADKALCPIASPGTGPFKTVDIPGANQNFQSNSRLYNYIGKLNFALNENNSLSLQYIGSPSTFDGAHANPFEPNPYLVYSFNGAPQSFSFKETTQTHDVQVHFVSKLLDRKLQLDVTGGFHVEKVEQTPIDGGDKPVVRDTRIMSLYEFDKSLTDCKTRTLMGGQGFNPCPVQDYYDNGFGFIQDLLQNTRYTAAVGLTYFLRLAGTHAFKLGADFEDNQYRDHRRYTGHDMNGQLRVLSGDVIRRQQFATRDAMGVGTVLPDGFDVSSSTLNYSVYLRDSWNVGFVPGLTINAGLRWEAQQVRDINGNTAFGIYDNLAPRVGFVYDWTQKGRSKIYASYGRFYESIPLDLNDRALSSEGFTVSRLHDASKNGCTTANTATGRYDVSGCNWPPVDASKGTFLGGSPSLISPVLKGQYSNEVVAGIQYDVGLDLVLGAAYVHRDLGRVMEDLSPDGGNTYFIGNPGDPVDAGTVADLQAKVNNLNNQISKEADPTKKAALQTQHDTAVGLLSGYQGSALFEKPKRDYNALVLTANKRLSHNFIVLASYTYSRTVGNYPGLYSNANGQLDPNISSQYDLKELLLNRNGPLPSDRPHNVKLTGAYIVPFGGNTFTIGATYNGLSGRPIEVLGTHPTYGVSESFLLPRGSGGRTPFLHSVDLRLAYARQFSKLLRLELSWDVYNVFNFQEVTQVDDAYAIDDALPLVNGTVNDLKNLKRPDGQQPRTNPNYGNATAYQSPLSMRFGLRVSF